jgi:hypothetical protein
MSIGVSEEYVTSETPVDFQWTTWRYAPEGTTLQKFITSAIIHLTDYDSRDNYQRHQKRRIRQNLTARVW